MIQINEIKKLNQHLWSSESGAMAVLVALALPVLIGISGLALDAGGWYVKKRTLQTAADAAALAGTYALANGDDDASVYDNALTDANLNSFDESGTGVLTVNTPAGSGDYAGDATTVEVILEEQAPLYFSSIFLSDPVIVSARAVAQYQVAAGNMCLLALDTSASRALEISGSVDLQMDCGIASNSSADDALRINGSNDIQVASLWSAGGFEDVGSNDITVETQKTYAAPVSDPYADVAVPNYSGCDYTDTSLKKDATLSPGVYCGGINIQSSAKVTMESGVYIIDGGGFDMSGSSSLSGSNVTIVLTSSSGSDYGTFSITGSTKLELSASTSGDMAGVALYMDRQAPYETSMIHGSPDVWISGAVYFPSQDLDYGGADDFEHGCVNLVAKTLDFHGSIDMQNYCEGESEEDEESVSAAVVKLVE